jgi:hypothetical protein
LFSLMHIIFLWHQLLKLWRRVVPHKWLNIDAGYGDSDFSTANDSQLQGSLTCPSCSSHHPLSFLHMICSGLDLVLVWGFENTSLQDAVLRSTM